MAAKNSKGLGRGVPGILLLSGNCLQPLACNDEALSILQFPENGCEHTRFGAQLEQEIRSKLVCPPVNGTLKFVRQFRSGNRIYLCRSLRLYNHAENDGQSTTTLVLLERRPMVAQQLQRKASEKYGLSYRERQIMPFLIDGLTTKEIAAILELSPNTVKSSLRMIMVKMRVSTRSGIVGKLFDTHTR